MKTWGRKIARRKNARRENAGRKSADEKNARRKIVVTRRVDVLKKTFFQ